MESITKLLISKRKKVKSPAFPFQELALQIMKEIPDAYTVSKTRIFKVCKDNPLAAKNALNDCKELDKRYIKYFFKVYSALSKV